jgi:glycosyltransferase involved in cell wall biosynthesis
MKLPKVLILNETFNNHSGGGITLSNLFSGWDKDKISVVCNSFRLEGNIDTEICKTYYQLGDKEFKYIFPFNIISRKRYSGLVNFDKRKTPDVIPKTKATKSSFRHKIVMKYLFPFLEYIGFIDKITSIQLSPEFCTWLEEFKPDLIYAQAHNTVDIKLILLIHDHLKKPLVFHMMDDWPLMVTGSRLLNTKQLKKSDKAIRKLLKQSDQLLSIGEGMSEAYKIRYGKDFTAFHNPIDIDFWKRYQRNSYELNDSPTILYAGRLGIGIDESLELIAKSIELVNKNLGLNMKFILQAKDNPSWSANYKCVEHRGFVSYSDLPKIFSSADFLILPYDFSPKSIQFIGYSMPTKATEYMISGTPIIIFAPEQTALVNYAKKHGWAKIITNNNLNALSEAITSLIKNKTERQKLAQTAIKVAENNHSLTKVTTEFRNILCSIANKTYN